LSSELPKITLIEQQIGKKKNTIIVNQEKGDVTIDVYYNYKVGYI